MAFFKKGLALFAQALGLNFVTTVVTGFASILVFGILGYLVGPLIGRADARRKLRTENELPEAAIIIRARGYKWVTAFLGAFLALLVFLLFVAAYGGGWLK